MADTLNQQLVMAVSDNKVAEAERLIKAGANVNCWTGDLSPIFIAVGNNNVKMVETLVRYGADVNQQDEGGYTVIYNAIDDHSDDVLRELLKAKNIDLEKLLRGYDGSMWSYLEYALDVENLNAAVMLYQRGVRDLSGLEHVIRGERLKSILADFLRLLQERDPRLYTRLKVSSVLRVSRVAAGLVDEAHNDISRRDALKSPENAFKYALRVLRAPFPEGEDLIATSSVYSYYYAKQVIKGPFPKGEDAIATDLHQSLEYAKHVLNGPFLKGEDTIARDGASSLVYALDVLKGLFPKGEDEIAKNTRYSFKYATDVLKRRFEKGEPAIFKYEKTKEEYLDWLRKHDVRGYTRLKVSAVLARETQEELNDELVRTVMRGDAKSVQRLLDEGADVNHKDSRGVTAVHIAISNFDSDTLKALLTRKELDLNVKVFGGNNYTVYALTKDNVLAAVMLYVRGVRDINNVKDEDIRARNEFLGLLQKKYPRLYVRLKVSSVLVDEAAKKEALRSPFLAYHFAVSKLKGPFPEGEHLIAQDDYVSMMYARLVLKGPFKKGEKAIAQDSDSSLKYVINVLKKRFELGEQVMCQDEDVWKEYLDFLKKHDVRGYTRIKE